MSRADLWVGLDAAVEIAEALHATHFRAEDGGVNFYCAHGTLELGLLASLIKIIGVEEYMTGDLVLLCSETEEGFCFRLWGNDLQVDSKLNRAFWLKDGRVVWKGEPRARR